MAAVFVHPQGKAQAGIQIKEAGEVVIDAEGLNQFHLPPFTLGALLFFPQFLVDRRIRPWKPFL